MKLDDWGTLILSWAEFLDPEEEIGSLENLAKSDLFSRLLGSLQCPFYQYSGDIDELSTFLQEQYPALDLDSLYKDSKQRTILIATTVLIYCTLHHEENELHKKMTELPNWTQLSLMAFLQEFVDIPKTEISQHLIFSEISKIPPPKIPGSAMNSPNFGTPVMYTSSPSTEGSKTASSSKKTSRIRRLRKEVDLLNNLKGELTEELEAAKEEISKLESTLHKKDQDLAKLRLKLENVDVKAHVCEVQKSNSPEKSKLEKLKAELEKLEQEKFTLEDELILAKDEKAAVYQELQRVRDVAQASEVDKTILQDVRMQLEAQIKELNMAIGQLEMTNKEQADYISELTKKDDSKRFSDSHGDSIIFPESLGNVIDLEIRELKEVIESKDETITELQNKMDNLKRSIQNFIEEKNGLMKSLREKETAFLQNSTELHEMRETFQSKISSLQTELDEKNSVCKNLEELRSLLNDELVQSKKQNTILESKLENMTDQYNIVSKEIQILNDRLLENRDIVKSLEEKLSVEEQKLMETLKQKSKDVEELKNVIMKLESDINIYATNISDLEKANKELSDELDSKIITIDNFESKVKFYETVNELIKSENKSLIDEVTSKEKVIDELENKFQSCQTDIATLENEKASISEKYNQMVKTCDTQTELIDTLQREIEEEIRKQMELSNELREKNLAILNLEDTSKALEVSLGIHLDQCERLKTEILALNEIVERSKSEVLHLQKVSEEKDSIIKSQNVSLNESSKQIIELQDAKQNLKQMISLKDKEIEELNTQICSHETVIKSKNVEIENMVSEIELKKNEVKEQLISNQKLQDDLQDKISVLNSEVEKLKASNHELFSEKEVLKAELQNLLSEKENSLSVLKSLEIEHSACLEKVKYLESVVHEVKDKENILKEELHKSNKREATLESEINNKSAVVSNLEEEVKTLKKTLENTEFNEGILYTKLKAKEAEINQMLLELSGINERLKLAEERHQEETKHHIQKIHDLDTTIGLMNNQFIKINIEKEALITELENRKDIEKEYKKLQVDYGTLKDENEILKNKVKTNSARLSEMQENCEKLEQLCKELENDKLNLKTTTEMHCKELNSLNETILELQSEICKRENAESGLLHEIDSKNDFISKLETEVSTLRNIHEELKSQESSLKEVLKNKDCLINKYAEEKNIFELNAQLFSKKEEDYKNQLEVKSKEIEEVYSKLRLNEDETEELKVKCSEQEQTIKGLYATLHSQNLEITLLQKEIKENVTVGRREHRSEEERGKSTPSSSQITEEDVEARISHLKASYERKVENYKATLKKRFAEKLEDLTYTLQNENTELKEKILKEQERCAKLQSELWNASDKLLITQEQNRTLMAKFQDRNTFEVFRPSEALSPISKARSMEVLSGRNRGIDNFARDISFNESDCSSRRSSIRSLPRGMGKVFPAAEEAGEVFDNRYLADLKAGVCNVQFDPNRVSTLQYRNSLCPPHLKSSYPLETQFIPSELREDDIKGAEKKCPMTPKYSQRQNGKEGVVNETFVLRESNSARGENTIRKPATPSRLRALFTHSKRDENSPRRKSMFLRKN